jgi:hypothetical protein
VTFKEIQDDALDAVLAITTAASSEPRTRIKRGINTWHRRLLQRPGFARLLRDFESTLTSVSGQAVYGLAQPLGRLNGLLDTVNRWPLRRRDLAWLRAQDPGVAISGTPDTFVLRGWFPTQIPPANPSSIFAVLNTTGTEGIVWQFLLSDGSVASGTTPANGTTAVQLGTASTVVEILDLHYDNSQVSGTRALTIREDSGSGTILGIIAPPIWANGNSSQKATKARYLRVQLWPTPTAAVAYTVDFTREMADLADDGDEPLLPPDYHYLLSLGAQHDELRRMSDDRVGGVRQDLEQGLRALNRWLWDLPTSYGDDAYAAPRRSQLGPMFPAGS